MKNSWYIKVAGGVAGPFTKEGLVARLETGSLQLGSLVRHGINGAWRELREVFVNLEPEGASSEAARQALIVKHRPAVGRRSQNSEFRSFWKNSVVWQLVGRVADFSGECLAWVTVRIGAHVTRRRLLIGGLLFGLVIVIRASPLMDTSLSIAIGNVDLVWLEAERLRDAEAGEEDWEEFEARSLAVLKPISESLVNANERSPGVWGHLWGTSESETEARHDLIQLAKNELPASLATGLEGTEVHDQRIEVCLDRLRSYNDGQNPYGLAANLESLPANSASDPWVPVIVGLDVVIVSAGVCGWWWMRRRRN